MISIENLSKRYITSSGQERWVLKDLNMHIAKGRSVGLLGRNGAGKSTLLRIIGGIEQPTRGVVRRLCRVSWPLGMSSAMQGTLSGRQNAKFVCRIHGRDADLEDRVKFIQDFSELGKAFNEPIKTYSTGMKAKLTFAMSLAFEFDLYLIDELTAVGDAVFKNKSLKAFNDLADRSNIIMASHSDQTLLAYCQSCLWITGGKAFWFDDIEEGLKAYRGSLPA
jgi:capsular polysaccharide transport system ATP-binding protein